MGYRTWMVRSMIHDIVFLTTLAIIWLVPAVLVARLAERRGYNFQTCLIIALAVPWPIMLFIVLIIPRRNEQSSIGCAGSS
jgi:hypothetical protein